MSISTLLYLTSIEWFKRSYDLFKNYAPVTVIWSGRTPRVSLMRARAAEVSSAAYFGSVYRVVKLEMRTTYIDYYCNESSVRIAGFQVPIS